ncbi:MAG: SufD family Fe-S cluster assembly protein [Bdellovibrionales bacterium]|nr:SufD family Fe-S cluster assembly protein [Bdellovibrionales bacterium]
MVDLNLLKDSKQLPWKSFSLHSSLKDVCLKNFKTIDKKDKEFFKIHLSDKCKVEIKYNISNPFTKPEESFTELKKLRSKKDFASFNNIFDDKQQKSELCFLLSVKEGQKLSHPIYINLPATQEYQNFKYGIDMQKNSFANIYETYQKNIKKACIHNVNSFISMQENSCLKFVSENSKISAVTSTRHMYNYLHKNSQFYLNYYSVENLSNYDNAKNKLEAQSSSVPDSVSDSVPEISSLYNVHTFLIGEAANFFEQALILAKNKTNRQHYSNIYHLKPYGQSSQLHKTMLDDSAKSIFNALIFIGSNCHKVNSHQLNNNLSFSKKTKIISQPQLQVKTDDVKATHGSTTGQVQAEELYYLQSRGISFAKSKQLLKQAFVKETQDNITNLIIKKDINNILKGYDE